MGGMRDDKFGGLDLSPLERYWYAWFAAILIIYLLPLGLRPLILPDEFRYAEIPRELISRHEWIVPTLNGSRYFEKPILGYWLGAAAQLLFGQSPFAVRLIPALFGLLTGGVICLYLRRSGFTLGISALAALIFMTSLMVAAMSSINTLDTGLSFFLTLSFASFYIGQSSPNKSSRILWLFFSGIASGFGFLMKGFLVFALIGMVVTSFLIWEKKWREIITTWWLPLIGALLVITPWALAIHAREPDYWNFFFWNEHVRRFLGHDAQHPEPVYYFFIMLLWGNLPWLVTIPAAAAGLSRSRQNSMFRYAACWFVIPFIFFSISKGKLAPYILPCYPPLAILTALGLYGYFQGNGRKLWDRSLVFFEIALVAGLMVFSLGQFTSLLGNHLLFDLRSWVFLMASLSLWILGVHLARSRKDACVKILYFTASSLPFFFLIHATAPKRLLDRRAPQAIFETYTDRVKSETILISDSKFFHAVSWSFKRDDVYVVFDPGELRYGFGYDDARARNLKSADEVAALVQINRGKAPVLIMVSPGNWEVIKSYLPQANNINVRDSFIVAEYLP